MGRKASFQISSNIEEYKALFDFTAHLPDELSFKKGDRIEITDKNENNRLNWWKGRKVQGDTKIGYLPKMYVTKVRNASMQLRLLPRVISSGEIDMKEVIGKGGFAIVRRGIWKNKEVAVKVIIDNSIKEMMENEAKIIWLLRHPNIISLCGVYIIESNYCLVMEFVKEGSLSDHLRKHFLTPSQVIDWSHQIAQGMNYLHNHAPTKSILHRDLKSTNVLLSNEGSSPTRTTLKITDFGLAKQSSQTLLLSNAAGTFEWMAPEVFRDHKVCKESDVWSFGVVFWEILTSQIPYKNFNQFQIVFGVGRNILQLPVPELCPSEFKNILESCWDREPKQRSDFQTLSKTLKGLNRSTIIADDEFANLQKEWVNEIDEKLNEKKSQNTREENELSGQDKGQAYLDKIVANLKQQYVKIQKIEMELIEQQIYYAVKKLNGVKKKPKKTPFCIFRKKCLSIGIPTDFQHQFHTIVEKNDVSPTLQMQRLRFTEVKNGQSSQEQLKEPPEKKIGFLGNLKEMFASRVSRRAKNPHIIPTKRVSMFPPSTSTPIKPNTLSLSTSHLQNQNHLEKMTESFSKMYQSSENDSFEIVQTHDKFKAPITENPPTLEDSSSAYYTVIPSNSENPVYNINMSNMKNSKYLSLDSMMSTTDVSTYPKVKKYQNFQPTKNHNSLQMLRDAHNVTVLKDYFDSLQNHQT